MGGGLPSASVVPFSKIIVSAFLALQVPTPRASAASLVFCRFDPVLLLLGSPSPSHRSFRWSRDGSRAFGGLGVSGSWRFLLEGEIIHFMMYGFSQ